MKSMQSHELAERNYRENVEVHVAKANAFLERGRAALTSGDAASARHHFIEAVMHGELARLDRGAAERAAQDLEPRVTKEAAKTAMRWACDTLQDLLPDEAAADADWEKLSAEFTDRFTVYVWSSARVCVGCGRLHGPTDGVEEAIALLQAGKRDEAMALHDLLCEREGHPVN
jgi:hypothetical protein